MADPDPVIIYAPAADPNHLELCRRHCQRRRYQVAAIARHPDGAWQALALHPTARVVVAARHHVDHLTDRFEVVAEVAAGGPPVTRRTSRARRTPADPPPPPPAGGD